jgi:uncharacterized RDD family membrane protein YckC
VDGKEDEIIMEKYHTFWPRFWAGVIDSIIFLPITWLDTYLGSPERHIAILIGWVVIGNFISLFYPVYFHAHYGQTIGKMAVGVKVLDVSEERLPTRYQAVFREIGLIVLSLMSVVYTIYLILNNMNKQQVVDLRWPELLITFSMLGWFLLEIFSMLSNPKHRAFHDFLAGTVVVKHR